MSILSELHDSISKAADNTKGWIEELEGKLPAIAAAAAKYEASPIVQALEGAVLPAAVEQEIANLIAKASEEFAKTGATSTTTAASTTPAATTSTTSTTAPAASAS